MFTDRVVERALRVLNTIKLVKSPINHILFPSSKLETNSSLRHSLTRLFKTPLSKLPTCLSNLSNAISSSFPTPLSPQSNPPRMVDYCFRDL